MANASTVSLGTDEIGTTAVGHNLLLKFFEKCNSLPDNEIILLDFTGINHFNGNMCALLTAMLYQLKSIKYQKFYVDEKNVAHINKKLKHLTKNGFLGNEDDNSGSDQLDITLQSFEQNDEKKFVEYIEHKLFENIKMKIDSDNKYKMIDKFLEMYSNVQLHARTLSPVFGCGQYQKNEHMLHFTLVDLGVGYLVPIEEHTNRKISTSESAIQWALQGNSTKLDAPGGTGLVDLLKYCNETGGHLNIVTGDTFWGSNIDNGNIIKINPFIGTTLHMMFNCS